MEDSKYENWIEKYRVDDSTFVDGLMNPVHRSLSSQKEDIIRAKLKVKGIDLDPDWDSKRRFKRFIRVCNSEGTKEEYYFNDGSIDGQLIVTFIGTGIQHDGDGIFSTSFNYY